jgi:hypothetical protein
MHVESGTNAGVDRRDDERLSVDDEAKVAEERLVENGVDGGPAVDATLGMAADGGV